MKTKIDYSGMTPEEKQKRAVADVKEFLGDERYDQLVTIFQTSAKVDLVEFHIMLSFAGIEGYPVEAFYNFVYEGRD